MVGGHIFSIAGVVVLVVTVGVWPLTRRVAGDAYAFLIHGLGLVLFVFAHDFGPPVLLGAVGAGLYVRSRGKPLALPRDRTVLREFGMVAIVYGLYELGRFLSRSSLDQATDNAWHIVSFEQSLGVFWERHFQDLMTGNASITALLNLIYSHGFLAFVMATLAWMYVVNPRIYRLLRDAMGVSALFSVITSAAMPVTPPRLMPDLGIVDTVQHSGGSHRLANAYAAMPSLHVGWMVLCGIGITMWLRGIHGLVLGALPGAAMLVVVIATGNHYWIDGVVGTFYGLVGIAVSQAARHSGATPAAVRETARTRWGCMRGKAAVAPPPRTEGSPEQ